MDDFLFTGNWFEKKYREKSGGRYPTVKSALNLVHQGKLKPRDELVIVETGTTRFPDDWGAGMSTVMFGDYAKEYGAKVYTVDIEEKNIETCKEVTSEFSDNIEYVVADSHEFLKEYNGPPIDLLYLDSLDYPLKPKDGTIEECQEHQLKEYRLAKRSLVPHWAVILLDDNDLPGGGKCALTKKELLGNLAVHIMDSQQSLWVQL